MKDCYKPMLICLGVAVAAILILPRFGVPIAGTSLLFGLVMIGCCVLPMLFMMKSNREGEKGSCCSNKSNVDSESKPGAEKLEKKSASCH